MHFIHYNHLISVQARASVLARCMSSIVLYAFFCTEKKSLKLSLTVAKKWTLCNGMNDKWPWHCHNDICENKFGANFRVRSHCCTVVCFNIRSKSICYTELLIFLENIWIIFLILQVCLRKTSKFQFFILICACFYIFKPSKRPFWCRFGVLNEMSLWYAIKYGW